MGALVEGEEVVGVVVVGVGIGRAVMEVAAADTVEVAVGMLEVVIEGVELLEAERFGDSIAAVAAAVARVSSISPRAILSIP